MFSWGILRNLFISFFVGLTSSPAFFGSAPLIILHGLMGDSPISRPKPLILGRTRTENLKKMSGWSIAAASIEWKNRQLQVCCRRSCIGSSGKQRLHGSAVFCFSFLFIIMAK